MIAKLHVKSKKIQLTQKKLHFFSGEGKTGSTRRKNTRRSAENQQTQTTHVDQSGNGVQCRPLIEPPCWMDVIFSPHSLLIHPLGGNLFLDPNFLCFRNSRWRPKFPGRIMFSPTKMCRHCSLLTFCASPSTAYALSICRLVNFPNGIFFKSI